jgi:rubrerythrin
MIKHLILVSMSALFGLNVQAAGLSQKTIDNLNIAYRGESNASHRYTLFAQKAEQDGYGQVAKLFRSAAQSEAIHRELHKSAIISLGGKVDEIKLDEVTVGTTNENLEAAIKGESYERDSMYPAFLAQARQDNAAAAIRSFTFAQAAEKEHARLYQDALNNLGHNAATDYFVCSLCGFTTTQLAAKNCPSCHNGVEKFLKIS